jgi:hypothetical protein
LRTDLRAKRKVEGGEKRGKQNMCTTRPEVEGNQSEERTTRGEKAN